MISRAIKPARTARNDRSMAAAAGAPIQADTRIATRPAIQTKSRARSGVPVTGRRPVQLGTAVSRKPAAIAGR
jgi:hypothetical protein